MKAFLLFTLLISNSALATDAIFSKMKPNEPICYGREYSLNHLEAHPDQTVQKIQSKFELRTHGEYQTRIMELEVTLKGKKNTNYRAFFICDEGNDYCGIECDGGRAEVTLSKNGNLVLKNEGFILEGGCGSEEGSKEVFLKSTPQGDDIFELVALPKDFCQKLDN